MRGRSAARAGAADGGLPAGGASTSCRSFTAARWATSGFEAVTQFEPTVPRAKKDDLGVPDAYFFITDTLLIFDHQERRIKIVANAHVTDPAQADRAYDEAVAKIEELEARLERPARARLLPILTEVAPLEPKVNMTRDAVRRDDRGDAGIHPRGRHFSGRAVAALRGAVRWRAARSLPRAAAGESVALHVLPEAGRHGAGRLVAGAACALRGGQGADPARSPARVRAARRRRRTTASARSCWPIPRNARSTSCWSISRATTWAASASSTPCG